MSLKSENVPSITVLPFTQFCQFTACLQASDQNLWTSPDDPCNIDSCIRVTGVRSTSFHWNSRKRLSKVIIPKVVLSPPEPTTVLIYLHICTQHFRSTIKEHDNAAHLLAGCHRNIYVPKYLWFSPRKKTTAGWHRQWYASEKQNIFQVSPLWQCYRNIFLMPCRMQIIASTYSKHTTM